MTPYETRRWVHRFVGSAALVLISSGTLVTLPDFRTTVIGGHGQLLSDLHMWLGFIFIAAPVVALLVAGKTILENLRKRIVDAEQMSWRRFHLTLTLCSGTLMASTGSVLLFDSLVAELPVGIMDILFWFHLAGAWILGMTLPIHLWMARFGIARTLKQWLGLEKNPRMSGKKVIISSGN